jgi:hypothetical protein
LNVQNLYFAQYQKEPGAKKVLLLAKLLQALFQSATGNHTRQIVSGNSQHDDDEVAASMELEAYDYQSRIEKALVVILPKEELFSLQVLSGIARSINFVRSKYAAKGAPYQVTPRMKQELRDRNLLQHVYTKAESVLEK